MEEKLDCAQGIIRKGGMKQLKAFCPSTELSNTVRCCAFVTDHPNKKQRWMNFSLRPGRSLPVAGELISEIISGQFLCTGVRWFDLVGAV